ncbi:hypothetical protein K491DRAFT_689717 [Lophiostoma macrostomum CBS 122681]|uniref:Uncharacterized protein n=1 Tax=Lophiostoma macrostomum CBS 122681 TaxID=1314788 RepID=A0A6A6TGL5_9PLEO|nr:hypothetical protein K491DRAFT_689717 [Lophiostoma macrostomum CBS 122681]
MPTKPQSPGPNTTTPTSRKAKTPKQDEGRAGGKAGSDGGIVLLKEQGGVKMSPAVAGKTSVPPPVKDAPATPQAQTGPNRQRRRPRKLNKEPTSQDDTKESSPAALVATPSGEGVPAAATAELEALKSRVRGLEAKVEELYKGGGDSRNRSPRRRGKSRKGSSQQVPTASAAEPAKVEEVEDEAEEELVRLEDELEVARRDLELYRPKNRPKSKRTKSEETEYIEEIPRERVGVEDKAELPDRQVTLSGSYRIPLPSNVSMDDVKTIQSGVSAAQNVARGFLEQRRARQAMQEPTPPAPKAKKAPTSTAVAKASETEGKQSWGEWFGGYSVAVSRAVKNIEAEAALENQRAGSSGSSTKKAPQSAKAAGTTSTKGASSTKPKANPKTAGKAAPRPSMKSRAATLSNEQVEGLMN